jgi:transcriptional regulator
MHPNPAFRQEPAFANLILARKRGFGTLCVNADPAPLLAHLPFVLDAAGAEAEMHLLRANPIARLVQGPTPAVIAVAGPDGYVSPDWYGGDPGQVPTWNYIAVHLRGTLHPADPAQMRAHIDRLSAQFEERLAPKRPWTADKMPDDLRERLMRTILPFRLSIETVDGTWKLNQNKPDAAREAAAAAIKSSPIGHEVETLAALMTGGVPEMDKDSPITYL